MENDKNLKDKVEEMSTRTFTVGGMPERDFQRFIKFCQLNARATKIFYREGKREVKKELIYSIAIKQLLDAYEADAKIQMLYDRLIKLEDGMVDKTESKEPERKVIKTMGRKEWGEWIWVN